MIVVGEALVRRKLPYKYLAGSNAVGIIAAHSRYCGDHKRYYGVR